MYQADQSRYMVEDLPKSIYGMPLFNLFCGVIAMDFFIMA